MADQSEERLNDTLNPYIEVVFDQSGLRRSSRDQPDRTFPCPHPGCDVICKRKYERDRHYQYKHVQSKDLFCPIGGCQCARDADELAKVFSAFCPDRWKSVGENWAALRDRMKADIIEDRSSSKNCCDGYSRVLLHGFARRDRIIKHIKKAHKVIGLVVAHHNLADSGQEVDTTAEEFSIERDALPDQPMFAEIQAFWTCIGENWWYSSLLGRIQRQDGTWTEWFGSQRAKVASAGFHKSSALESESYRTLMKEKSYERVLPWEAHAILQKLKSPVVAEHQGIHDELQPAKVSAQNSSMQLLPTVAEAPEIPIAGISSVAGYGVAMASSSHPHKVTDNAPAFFTPGDSGDSLATDGGVLTPMDSFGENQQLNMFTSSNTVPVIDTTSAAQETNFWSGHFNLNSLAPAYQVSVWDDGAFDLGSMFNDDFNFDTLPQWAPEAAVEQAIDQQEGEAGDYNGLGKRRFSDV